MLFVPVALALLQTSAESSSRKKLLNPHAKHRRKSSNNGHSQFSQCSDEYQRSSLSRIQNHRSFSASLTNLFLSSNYRGYGISKACPKNTAGWTDRKLKNAVCWKNLDDSVDSVIGKIVSLSSRDFPMGRNGCRSCAIVGSSGILAVGIHFPRAFAPLLAMICLCLGHKHGPEIDKHDVVIRMNNAPTDGWEDIVGKKTSLRLAYQCCGSTNVTLFEVDIKKKGAQVAFINYGSSAYIDLCSQ